MNLKEPICSGDNFVAKLYVWKYPLENEINICLSYGNSNSLLPYILPSYILIYVVDLNFNLHQNS